MAITTVIENGRSHMLPLDAASFWRWTNSPLTEPALKPGDDWIPSSTWLGIINDISTVEQNDNPHSYHYQ